MPSRKLGIAILASVMVLGLAGCRVQIDVEGLTHMGKSLKPFTQVSGQADVPAGITNIIIEARVGDVNVQTGAASDRTVSIDASVRLEKGRVETEPKGEFGDHVRVITSNGTLTIADAHTDDKDQKDWGVALDIVAPAGLTYDLNTGTGNVSMDGSTADLSAHTGTGDVRVTLTDSSGDVNATTGTGNVDVEAAGIGGALRATTGTGNVEAVLEDADGPVAVKTGTGNAACEFSDRSPRDDVSVTSGTGNCRLALPPGSAGDFHLKTGVGSVRVPGDSGLRVRKQVTAGEASGVIGGGGPKISVTTGVGDVTLE